MTPLDLKSELNPEQIAAVTHGEGPQLVLAGAGSGKTRVITYRIAWLVQERGIRPREIVAVTFTNKAAGEMAERAEKLLGQSPVPAFVGTFHRYALRLLRRYGDRVGLRRDFAVLDQTDQLGLVREALEAESLAESAFAPRAVLARISSAKSRLLDPDGFEAQAQGFFENRVAAVYRCYQGLLRRASGVDFDDLIGLAVRLLATEGDLAERLRHRVRYLLVDEFQDTNHAQLWLILALSGRAGNLTAVGDEDQGIYRWRGADLDNILEFEQTFPGAKLRKLERSYRSTQNILDASGALVAHNSRRHGKRLWTDAGSGEAIELYRAHDERDEARWVATTLQNCRQQHRYSEMAMLVRTNAQTRVLEDELLRHGVPYCLVAGVRFYDRAEIKDLVAYLRVLRNPRDSFSLMRILNRPPRGIGKATQDLLEEEAQNLGQPTWDVLCHEQLSRLPTRGARALRSFRDLILDLQDEAKELPLPALLDLLLERTGYAQLYSKGDVDSSARLENIGEFLSAAQEFVEGRLLLEAEAGRQAEVDHLTLFLDHIALVSDLDGWEAERGVSLMTLHSAKGLEFPLVIIGGLEEGLLPHFNAQGGPDDIEEERRLLYVGMTRARECLLLASCRRRRVAGRYQNQTESSFLQEIPAELLEVTESPSLFRDERTRGVVSFFGEASPAETPGEAPGLRKGARVRHATLGQGVVLDLEGEGEEMKLTVFFNRAGKRKLVAKYAALEVL